MKIDQTYVLNTAKLAKSKGVSHFSIVTALGADPNSMLLYNRSKGQTEEGLKKVGFEHLSIFRPSLLEAERTESRWGVCIPSSSSCIQLISFVKESFARAFSWTFHFTSARAIKVEQVAKAMIADAFREDKKQTVAVFENSVIHKM